MTTILDKVLGDLRREVIDLRQDNYDMTKLNSIINVSKDSLKETGKYQQELLKQLQQFECSLAEINQILRANVQRKVQLEQQQQESGDDIEIRAKLMALNAEALECRAAAVQLQQEARLVMNKAADIEKHVNDELAQQDLENKAKQKEFERNRAMELEKRIQAEEQRQRIKAEQQQHQQERLLPPVKASVHEDEYANWPVRDFMQDNQYPPCIIRTSPEAVLFPIELRYLSVNETENLLDNQEELVSTPMKIKFDSTEIKHEFLLLSIPYISKRSSHRENVIKIRQANGIWLSLDSLECLFDTHKDKRFVECKLSEPSSCAVVSRLKRDQILIETHRAGRYHSSADPRFTLQWPKNVSQTDFRMDTCMHPVDLPTFNQFCQNFAHECEGLLAVGPIIELNFEEINLLKPIQFTLPILVQPKKKKKVQTPRSNPEQATTTASDDPNNQQQVSTSQPSQQELINQQQQSIFKSVLGEDLNNEHLVLLYSGFNENNWHIDSDLQLNDSTTHDLITTNIQLLHSRMIIVRCDKQLMPLKRLQSTITLLEQTLTQRTALFLLRHRLSNPNEICLVCCSNQRTDLVEQEIQQENYTNLNEQIKEIILQEGQILELRFRGNVLPIDNQQQSIPFAFNTYFPFYFEANVKEIDKYSQHLSKYFYGFIQIFSKQKILKNPNTKEIEKKKLQIENIESDICLAELLVILPKPPVEMPKPIQKSLPTFTGEGVLTPTLFRDMSASLNNDEWRKLARRLGITRIRIEAIEHDFHEDAPYYMLLAWFKRVARSSDKVLTLMQALININRWDLAQDLQSIKEDKRIEQRTLSKDDQLKMFQAPFNRICQREECIRIWKQLARELMLTNEEILSIEQRYPSKHERCYRSLEHWALNQTRADIPILAKILRTLGFKTLAREIENMA